MAERMRATLAVTRIQIGKSARKPIVWLGLLLGLTFSLPATIGLMRAALDADATIQILEGFLFLGNDYQQCMPIMIGMLVVFADVPFIDEQIYAVGIRVSRRQWAMGQMLYIFLVAVCYFLCIAAFTILVLAARGYAGNLYSAVFTQVARDQTLAYFTRYQLAFSAPGLLSLFSVYQLFLMTFAFQWLYGCALSLTMFSLDLVFRHGVGMTVALTLNQVGYILVREGAFWANQRLSPMRHALPAMHSWSGDALLAPTMAESLILWGVWLSALCAFSLWRAKYRDFAMPHRNE